MAHVRRYPYLRLMGLALMLALLGSCGRRPPLVEAPAVEYEYRQLDTLVVAATRISDAPAGHSLERPPYRPSRRRTLDLLHTALDLHFDWDKATVIGTAILRLSPYLHPTAQVRLDAKGMTIHGVSRFDRSPLPFSYDDPSLNIQLDRPVAAGDTIELMIQYTARPAASGGSRAIRSDQGLYFIPPDPDRGRAGPQLWTQGETEANSRWFPTLDQPNERATQDIRLTVPDSLRTLSNGLLVGSRANANGTRTDHWRLDLPHAPYLAMIAAGDFALEQDTIDGLLYQYYLDPEYAAEARNIFPRTPDMMRFFSEYLAYPYPWPKYAQVVVRDFVSGAMENTTAVVFGSFMLASRPDEADRRSNEKIVAHELFHHWFGNLVTCESWANLTLNEGFASYGEYLWLEEAYGRTQADLHLEAERQAYFAEAERRMHPLIHYRYREAESLFDRHSYNKGAAVLHMLRDYVGERAFRRALSQYLRRHAFEAVEIHDLRLAFERVAGEDLNWFFDQWFLEAGHPVLDIDYRYDSLQQHLVIEVEQRQDTRLAPAAFILPTEVQILGEDGWEQNVELRIDERRESFTIPVEGRPATMRFDPRSILLAEKKETRSMG